MAPRQTQARSRIAWAASITLLLAASMFVTLVSANVAGTNKLVGDVAWIITIICLPVSVIAWTLVLRLQRSLLPSLITFGGSWILCYFSYGLFGLTTDGFLRRKAPFINTDVLQLATFGAAATIFFVLVIASLITILYHLWSLRRGTRHR